MLAFVRPSATSPRTSRSRGVSSASASSSRRRREQLLHDLRIERRAPVRHALGRFEELADVEHAVLQQVAEARRPELTSSTAKRRLDVLREDEHGGARMRRANLDGCAHAFVLVGRRHADVDDREVGIVLGDDGEQRLGVADAGDDVVTGVLEQAGEALAQEDGVLRDHDPHGIATSTRVPSPRGLTISSVPPCAATRSRRPARPDPRRTTAPPTPSSATVTCSVPLSWTARTVTFDGDPCLTAFVSASHATKYAAASTLAGARSPLASTSTGTGDVLARSRKRRGEPVVEPRRSNACGDLTQVGDRRPHLGDDLVERG